MRDGVAEKTLSNMKKYMKLW